MKCYVRNNGFTAIMTHVIDLPLDPNEGPPEWNIVGNEDGQWHEVPPHGAAKVLQDMDAKPAEFEGVAVLEIRSLT